MKTIFDFPENVSKPLQLAQIVNLINNHSSEDDFIKQAQENLKTNSAANVVNMMKIAIEWEPDECSAVLGKELYNAIKNYNHV